MSFGELRLHSIVVRNLARMGYRDPRPVQAAASEPILQGRDLLALAHTGTGKTGAFIAPLADRLLAAKPPQRKGARIAPMTRLRALVLCPTRELAQQVAADAAAIMQGSVLRSGCAVGKSPMAPQARAIARGIDLLVATPGRTRELLDAGGLSLAFVRHVVIDEADRMMDLGFLPQVRAILQAVPQERQTLLFTATMPPEVDELASTFLNDPVRIEIGRQTTPAQHVQQRLIPVDDRDKVSLLLHLIEQGHRTGVLVFCNTRRRVGWVGRALERHSVKVGLLHGDRSQPQRQKALSRFGSGELQVLVATDVAARGLHVPAVQTVINYDLPVAPQEYVHRVGRAAHGDPTARGEAYSFLAEHDRLRWRAVLDTTGIEVFAEDAPGFERASAQRRDHRVRSRGGSGASASRSAGDAKHAADSPRRLAPGAERDRRRPDPQEKKSRKSRPIRKGQQPGKGVIRPGKPR